jgi:hypothetical protein
MTNRPELLKSILDLSKDKSFQERSPINNVPTSKVNQPLNYEKPKTVFGSDNVDRIIGLPPVNSSQLPFGLDELYNHVLTIYRTIYYLSQRGLS